VEVYEEEMTSGVALDVGREAMVNLGASMKLFPTLLLGQYSGENAGIFSTSGNCYEH
jgi:hypothetical protein